MSKLVPSPDWFVGLDGLNLCENGKFVDSVTVEVQIDFYMHDALQCLSRLNFVKSFLKATWNARKDIFQSDPMDAGTDNGFTFTAPNWATTPPAAIFRITNVYPTHPASSFHYPDIDSLPTIATFSFIKVNHNRHEKIFFSILVN